MSAGITDRFVHELNPGEKIIWAGQPEQGLVLKLADILVIPFTFLWSGALLFGMFAAVMEEAPSFFMVGFLPLVLIALYVTVGRFVLDIAQRRATYYALTHERVIILSGLLHQNIKSVNFRRLQEINVSVKRNGRGTITFGHIDPMAAMYEMWGSMYFARHHPAPRFEMIDDVRMVYEMIKMLQREG